MSRSRKRTPDAPGRGDTGVPLSQFGLSGTVVSRRTALKAGLGVAAGARLAGIAGTATAPPARAGLNKLAQANAFKVAQLTGPTLTGRYDAPYVDLGIPVQRADGTLLFVGGDTYGPNGVPGDHNDDWRCPTGLTGPGTDPKTSAVSVTGAITAGDPNRATGFIDAASVNASQPHGLPLEGHAYAGGTRYTTAIPSDVFRVPGSGTLYLSLMRGVIYDADHTDFWKSENGGASWDYLRKWDKTLYNGFFQQKTYAAETSANDPYVYVLTTAFNRGTRSDMYLFRVFKSDLSKNEAQATASGYKQYFAYQPWGYANGRWAWGNAPTSVLENRLWGEICFRALDGQYALSFFSPDPDNNFQYADIRAMRFPLPTSNLVATTEQTMVYNSAANPGSNGNAAHVQPALYGGFILPGSTLANFNFLVSNWDTGGQYAPQNNSNYVVSHWRTTLNPNI